MPAGICKHWEDRCGVIFNAQLGHEGDVWEQATDDGKGFCNHLHLGYEQQGYENENVLSGFRVP